MRRVLMLLVVALTSIWLVQTPASASTFELGVIEPGDSGSGFVANFGTGIVSFEDTIKFSLTAVSTSLVGAITDVVSAGVDSVNFALDLFSAADPTTSLGTVTDVSGVGLAFSYLNLAAGDYFFRVAGATGSDGNFYRYSFTAGTEVPIPPALLLFATALGGMAVTGYRRRKMLSKS